MKRTKDFRKQSLFSENMVFIIYNMITDILDIFLFVLYLPYNIVGYKTEMVTFHHII